MTFTLTLKENEQRNQFMSNSDIYLLTYVFALNILFLTHRENVFLTFMVS